MKRDTYIEDMDVRMDAAELHMTLFLKRERERKRLGERTPKVNTVTCRECGGQTRGQAHCEFCGEQP